MFHFFLLWFDIQKCINQNIQFIPLSLSQNIFLPSSFIIMKKMEMLLFIELTYIDIPDQNISHSNSVL